MMINIIINNCLGSQNTAHTHRDKNAEIQVSYHSISRFPVFKFSSFQAFRHLMCAKEALC